MQNWGKWLRYNICDVNSYLKPTYAAATYISQFSIKNEITFYDSLKNKVYRVEQTHTNRHTLKQTLYFIYTYYKIMTVWKSISQSNTNCNYSTLPFKSSIKKMVDFSDWD